jgi:hypothetical protein
MGSCASVVRKKDIQYTEFTKNKKYHNNNQNIKMSEGSSNEIYNTTPRYIYK